MPIALRLIDHFGELVDKRVFQAVITGTDTTVVVTWLAATGISAADLADAQFEYMGITMEKSAGASFTHFGPVPLSKTVSGFSIQVDSPPGVGESYTFTGWVLRAPGFS